SVTTDGFFVTVDAADPLFDPARTVEFLRELGAVEVELCPRPEGAAEIPRGVYWALAVMAVSALLPPLFIARARNHTLEAPQEQPRIHIIKDMDFQPKLKTQRVSMLFPDRLGMRPPVPGTLPFDPSPAAAVDRGRFETGREGEQFLSGFPIPVDAALMQRGRERYNIYCATCHGLTGEGGLYDGMTARRARARGETLWVPPAALTGQSVREQPVGKIFDTITHGVVREGRHTMPPYAVQMPPQDRWAVVLYVLALQRARAPLPGDFGTASRAAVSPSPSGPTAPTEDRAAERGTRESLASAIPGTQP
ncbi:MAG: c-type cytochrome, partial [Thermogutta sp.]|nr:c-type cytochrome [Thermogutta sp.]